jgi:hypothetical protein
MMDPVLFLYMVLLFVLLTPGILLSLPPKGSKWTVAIVHALVFTTVWCFTYKLVWGLLRQPTGVVAV